MANGSDVSLHIIAAGEIDHPVIKTTSELPINSVLNTGLAPTQTTRDAFRSLAVEDQENVARMVSINASERGPQLDVFNSKDSVLIERNPDIPYDPAQKVDGVPGALTEQAINKGIEDATGRRVPPVDLKAAMANSPSQRAVSEKVQAAQSSGISFNA